MARAFNILNQDGDILIDSEIGIRFGDDTAQLQTKILLLKTGDLKHDPFTGVGIENYLLEDDSLLGLQQTIQFQFEKDEMVIESMDLTKSSVIKARYGN
ncbi:MAG: hypothetical protein LCH37_12940 [Bacteroidetes bacterium]|nr:hypothetical protein [Bacteroidota bacterium]